MSTGTLFPKHAQAQFKAITLSRYTHMCERHEKKKLPPPPFTMPQLRDHILEMMGWSYGGAITCRYCHHPFDLAQAAIDHAVPLERGGDLELRNLEVICAACNAQKGEMLPQEFADFLELLKNKLPYARTGILERLQMHSKLMANLRKAEMFARNGGKMPPKKALPGKPPIISAIDENF